MIAEAGVPVTPTLLAPHRPRDPDCAREHGTAEFVLSKMKTLQPYCFETFQKMHKAGVKIAMGTDMGFEPDMGTNAARAGDLRQARHEADGRDPHHDAQRRAGAEAWRRTSAPSRPASSPT